MMGIAVAISTRNRADALSRCLDSIAAGSAKPNEIVVVDQGDDDRAADVVAARSDLPAIRYIRQHERGLAVSQNTAIRAAAVDVVAVTDDDCVVDGTWLETAAAAFEADPTLGLLTGRVLPLETDDPNLLPVSTRPSPTAVTFVAPTDPWLIGSGNNFAVRRPWFEAVGGCDVRLGPGTPGRGALDMDLFYRLLRAGSPARYEPRALVFHEQKSREERRLRRPDYGFGMGACCVFWRRAGDPNALPVLRRWLGFRAGLLVACVRRLRLRGAHEELLMLLGTVRGLFYAYAHSRS
jgi:GT2 family glycosyltransferase